MGLPPFRGTVRLLVGWRNLVFPRKMVHGVASRIGRIRLIALVVVLQAKPPVLGDLVVDQNRQETAVVLNPRCALRMTLVPRLRHVGDASGLYLRPICGLAWQFGWILRF